MNICSVHQRGPPGQENRLPLRGRVGRRIALSPDGRHVAVLTGSEGVDYNWRGAIVDVASGNVTPFGDIDFRRLAWTPRGLLALGYLGYWFFDENGRLLVDGRHAPEPGSAWMGSAATRDGSRIFYMHHHRLASLAVDDGRALPAPDITPFARPTGDFAWASPHFAVGDDVLALGFRDEVILWRIGDGELVARIVPIGVRITNARPRFVGDELVMTFTHVWNPSGVRKSIATYDVATARITDVITTEPGQHGGKGMADGALLIAHGASLVAI